MYCEKCDQHFPDNHRFCSNCGGDLQKPSAGTIWIPTLVLAGMFAVGLLTWLFV